jgi:NAD(P)-dependent dehydrogenase (short-subunit alcohol dehydrogenase family)
VKGNFFLARAFLPYKKGNGTIVASSSCIAFLPPGLPFLARISAYSISKLGMARFYEYVAVEHPDLNVFNVQPAIVETDLYTKGELNLDTLDTSKLTRILMDEDRNLTVLQLNSRHISQSGWQARSLKNFLDVSCLATGM